MQAMGLMLPKNTPRRQLPDEATLESRMDCMKVTSSYSCAALNNVNLDAILDDIKCNLRKEQHIVLELNWHVLYHVLAPIQVRSSTLYLTCQGTDAPLICCRCPFWLVGCTDSTGHPDSHVRCACKRWMVHIGTAQVAVRWLAMQHSCCPGCCPPAGILDHRPLPVRQRPAARLTHGLKEHACCGNQRAFEGLPHGAFSARALQVTVRPDV